MKGVRFEAKLTMGHKGVVVVLVPFDPEATWKLEPVPLAGRRHGWPVRGSVGRTKLDGYIGERWGRFFVIVDAAVREAAGVAVGDVVSVSLTPTADATVLALAVAQSKLTTQPTKARTPTGEVSSAARRRT